MTEGAFVVYLIVGLDRNTFARWHGNVAAPNARAAERIARARSAAQGIQLVVAAAIGPYSSVVKEQTGDTVAKAA
jgi:hypothetical protein